MNLRYAPSSTYLVMDFVGGGELFARLSASRDHALSVKEARFYAAELVLALEHLHANDIVYRDLKPENILIQRDGHVCLTDFGFAKENITEADKGTDRRHPRALPQPAHVEGAGAGGVRQSRDKCGAIKTKHDLLAARPAHQTLLDAYGARGLLAARTASHSLFDLREC